MMLILASNTPVRPHFIVYVKVKDVCNTTIINQDSVHVVVTELSGYY